MKNKHQWIVSSMLALLMSIVLVQSIEARGRFQGGVFVGRGLGPWGWYDPFFYGPYPYSTFGYSNAGQLKLDTEVKDADVYINGVYAGKAGKLKSIWLPSKTYDLEVRAPGRRQYAERIFIVPGKTLHIRPDLRIENG